MIYFCLNYRTPTLDRNEPICVFDISNTNFVIKIKKYVLTDSNGPCWVGTSDGSTEYFRSLTKNLVLVSPEIISKHSRQSF